MSADAASLPCPVCSHTGIFDTAQALKDRLIYVSTNTITCPVCQEEVLGLDKLTIHLFSHVKVIAAKEDLEMKITSLQKAKNTVTEQNKKKKSVSKNKTTVSTGNTQVKFVKIYPKLPVIAINTMPVIDIRSNPDGNGVHNHNPLYMPTVKTETSLLQSSNNKCNICGLHFVDSNILRMHKCLIHNIQDNVHQQFTRYNCHICTKSFKMRGSLMVHLRVAHYGFNSNNNEQQNIKESCNENNECVALENKPVEIERNDCKQWQCDVCHKCFTTKYFLKKHKRLHTG